jgi:hypothetical protein
MTLSQKEYLLWVKYDTPFPMGDLTSLARRYIQWCLATKCSRTIHRIKEQNSLSLWF